MQPATIEALVIISLVLSPGYIFTQVARRLIAHVPEATDLRLLLTIITYGTVIQALAFPFWTNRLLGFYLDGTLRRHQTEAFLWVAAVCLLLPVGLGVLIGRLTLLDRVDKVLDAMGLGYTDRMPSAWDYVADQSEGSYVIVHLRDDQGVVAGVYGATSFASLDPARRDVYLESAWRLDDDDNFVEPIADTRGVWIAHDVIAYVEFFDQGDGADGDAAADDQPAAQAEAPP